MRYAIRRTGFMVGRMSHTFGFFSSMTVTGTLFWSYISWSRSRISCLESLSMSSSAASLMTVELRSGVK